MLQLKHDDQREDRGAKQHGDPDRFFYPETRGRLFFLQATPMVFNAASCKTLPMYVDACGPIEKFV